MTLLHNRISQKELKEALFSETEPRTTVSFYKYIYIGDPKIFRDGLYENLNRLKIFGRIYIAHEGINGQLSVPTLQFEILKNYFDTIPILKGIRLNEAVDDDGKSFWVLKIKIREKIVADGIADPSFNMNKKGKYVNAFQFNEMAALPETVIVDMRNHYEYEVGHFVNALEVPSDTFRQQLPMAVDMLKDQKEKNIILYCTGGIRCEKAGAFLMHHGFQSVYHLDGGIIQYAHQVKEQGLENKFLGKNFVFDGRLGEKIGEEIISCCHQCGIKADHHTNCTNEACHLLFIQCDNCAKSFSGCCSASCQQVLALSEEEKKIKRKGSKNGLMIFNKSRQRMDGLKIHTANNQEHQA